MSGPDPLRGLSADRLRNYLDQKTRYETDADRDMIEATLAAAIGFCESYCRTTFADPVAPELADAIYTAAARQWRERDAAFSEVAQRALGDGPDVTYFRGLPQRVKMVYDLYQAPFRVEFS